MLYNEGSHPFLLGNETKKEIFTKLKNPYYFLKNK